jgi:hypothetical protein
LFKTPGAKSKPRNPSPPSFAFDFLQRFHTLKTTTRQAAVGSLLPLLIMKVHQQTKCSQQGALF